MLKRRFFLLAFLALPFYLWPNTFIPLDEAVKKGLIQVSVSGLGGHGGQCIQLQITRNGQTRYKIGIPAGHVFLPDDSTTQNIIVVKEEQFTLSASKTTLKLWGLCSQPTDGSPQTNETFQVGRPEGGALQKMAEYISANQLFQHPDAQTAIWAMVDTKHLPGIGHKGLLNTACQILNAPLPEYAIKRLSAQATPTTQATRTVRRAPAYVREPMLVEGFFQYDSKDKAAVVSAFLIDSAGQKVKTFFEAQKQEAGVIAKYKFEYKTTKLPPGRYEAVFYVDDRPKKRIVIRY